MDIELSISEKPNDRPLSGNYHDGIIMRTP